MKIIRGDVFTVEIQSFVRGNQTWVWIDGSYDSFPSLWATKPSQGMIISLNFDFTTLKSDYCAMVDENTLPL